jgi:hypothetical protein
MVSIIKGVGGRSLRVVVMVMGKATGIGTVRQGDRRRR